MFQRLQPWMDRFVPDDILGSGDRDLVARSRTLVGGAFALCFLAFLCLPPTLILSGPSIDAFIVVLGGLASLSAAFVFRWTGSLRTATTSAMLAVSAALWAGAYHSGGFEGSTLRALAVVPLLATFIVNARLGVTLAIVMALSVELFYYIDQAGYPFPEPASVEGERWFAAQVAVLEIGFVTGLAWLFAANRRAFTERLQASADRSQAILDHMEHGVALFTSAGTLSQTNGAFVRLLGLGDTLSIHPDLVALCARVSESGTREHITIELPDGGIGDAAASPIVDGDAAARGTVLLIRDVTLETEVDRMKTEFISSVSHELRTPLTSILGFTKLTRNKLETRVFPTADLDDPKRAKAVKQIRNNLDVVMVEGDRLTAMINDVLDISKMESGAMEYASEPVQPAELVARTVAATSALFADGSKTIDVQVNAELPTITGDFHRLQQVLINLISNAAKFADQRVHITVRAVDQDVEFAVVDDGSGIASDQLSSVFEKFRQLEGRPSGGPTGTGLGLPISKRIVTAHGGLISVESTLGSGARFVVTLPAGDRSAVD